MNHRANADFWNDYHALPADIWRHIQQRAEGLPRAQPIPWGAYITTKGAVTYAPPAALSGPFS
jgi:hypothetical protein